MRNLALCLFLTLGISACAEFDGKTNQQQQNGGDASTSTDGGAKYATASLALKMEQVTDPQDPTSTVWIPQACTPTDDPTCSAAGPYQLLHCDPDHLCRFYTASEKCAYPAYGQGTASKTCDVIRCAADADCDQFNPDAKHLGASCVYTSESMLAADSNEQGECFFTYADCKPGLGTPCENKGVMYAKDNQYVCSVSMKLNLKQAEVCGDSQDNDCDGDTDEMGALNCVNYWVDGDSDGQGNDSADAVSKCLCGDLTGYVKNNTDCNDSDSAIKKGVPEVCDGVDNNCSGASDEGLSFANYYADTDGDTYGAGNATSACKPQVGKVTNNTDCDDTKANVFEKKLYYVDGDGDLFGSTTEAMLCSATAPTGYSSDNIDCDDTKAGLYEKQLFYVDTDGDSYGSTTEALLCATSAPFGYSPNKSDCNDGAASVNPGASESCNGVDDDCSGAADNGLVFTNYYADTDSDTYGAGNATSSCKPLAGEVTNSTDCADNDATVNAPQPYYVDGDKDGFGSKTPALVCSSIATEGYSINKTDCDDTKSAINPDAVEICNQVDDDCDGTKDIDPATSKALCDLQCPLVKSVAPDQPFTVNTATMGVSSNLQSYHCGTASKPVSYQYLAKDVFLAPACALGSKFSVFIKTQGTTAILARLTKSCAPNSNTMSVTPVLKGGTCAMLGTTSVKEGIVGTDYVVVDAQTDVIVDVQFTCVPAPLVK